jgi:Icc protein
MQRSPVGDNTRPLRILHLTDPHLFADAGSELRGRVTHDTLEHVLAHYLNSAWPADLALVTGDVVQDDTREAYDNFCRLLSSLRLPVYCLPGNHDVRPLMREVLTQNAFAYCETIDSGAWRIICIDSCETGVAAGRVSPAELRRLASLLREPPAEHVMVALHHPPLRVGTPWLDEVGLLNGEELLAAVSDDPRVGLVVFGHVHQAFDAERGSLRILGTPSTCRQFEVGSESFAVDDRPPAYRRLTLHPDGRIETGVVWVGQA